MCHFRLLNANGRQIADTSSGDVIDVTLCILIGVANEGTVVSIEEVMQQHT